MVYIYVVFSVFVCGFFIGFGSGGLLVLLGYFYLGSVLLKEV